MNSFQKRALAYNAYRALRKLANATNGDSSAIAKSLSSVDNNLQKPVNGGTAAPSKNPPGFPAKSNISRPVKRDWYRKISKSGKKGCC